MDVNAHRLQPCLHSATPEVFSFEQPFSSFQYVDEKFSGSSTVRRCFSLARILRAKTVVSEEIDAADILKEEIDDMSSVGFLSGRIFRLSFWNLFLGEYEYISHLSSKNLVGYCILKEYGKNPDTFSFHVFEAVFAKYPHPHNCIPRATTYSVKIGRDNFEILGVLYCQQNGITATCAQVGLRSMLSTILQDHDISYRKINKIAGEASSERGEKFDPSRGMAAYQIDAVFQNVGVNVKSVHYNKDGEVSQHIIPFFGHTFNKDTWVPAAEKSYFKAGERLRYLPSSLWTSSFIGHDDNFGPNFCVPQFYVDPKDVVYVAALMTNNVKTESITAGAWALSRLHWVMESECSTGNNPLASQWRERLFEHLEEKSRVRPVLRSLVMTSNEYIASVRDFIDWEGNSESSENLKHLKLMLGVKTFWVVEISIPQLFPANERKIGEILIDASIEDDATAEPCVLIRLPGVYLMPMSGSEQRITFAKVSSNLCSHVNVYAKNGL